jgi:hypothetical protein
MTKNLLNCCNDNSCYLQNEVMPMELPNNLNLWTIDTVINIVKEHEFEPGLFDYKSVLHATGSKQNEYVDSIRRTACSMANTDGGFILFGVLDRKQQLTSVEERIKGIPIQGDLRKEFGDKIANIQPEVYFEAVPRILPLPNDSNRGIFVVRIPRSQRRPHMVSSVGIYYRRGENGAATPMNHYEVRDLMMYTEERLRKVILFRLEINLFRRKAAVLLGQKSYTMSTISTLYHIDVSTYKVLLADISGLLPPSVAIFEEMLNITICIDTLNRFMRGMQDTYGSYGPIGVTLGKAAIFLQGKKFKEGEEYFRDALNTLDEKCAFCEKYLEELFGPLGTNITEITE